MPRPMVPQPATPAKRSLREASSMAGGVAILAAGAGYNRPSEEESMRAIVTVALIALASAAAAQSFPAKPVTLICPWPPGGTTDTHLRKFAEVAAKYLGQPVVIENKPGAGGRVSEETTPGGAERWGRLRLAAWATPAANRVSPRPIPALPLPHQRAVD